ESPFYGDLLQKRNSERVKWFLSDVLSVVFDQETSLDPEHQFSFLTRTYYHLSWRFDHQLSLMGQLLRDLVETTPTKLLFEIIYSLFQWELDLRRIFMTCHTRSSLEDRFNEAFLEPGLTQQNFLPYEPHRVLPTHSINIRKIFLNPLYDELVDISE